MASCRIALAALLAWTLVLLGAGTVVLGHGADLYASAGLQRRGLALAPSTPSPVAPVPVAPVEAAAVPWSLRLSHARGPVGTGTLVAWQGRRYLVTAAHVVSFWSLLGRVGLAPGPQPIFCLALDGTWWALPWGRVHAAWDLALYPTPDPRWPALELRDEVPRLGETVRFSGYPFGEDGPWAASGPVVVATAHPSEPGAAAVVAAIAPRTGQSGGALLDMQGRLVGIGVARTPGGLLAVGSGAIAATLAEAERLVTPEPLSPVARGAAAVAVLLVVTGLTVALDRVFQRIRRPFPLRR